LDRLERLKKVREKTLCNLTDYESPAFFCDISPNAHVPEFIDVFIADGQEILPEWIARGAVTLPSAIDTAEQAIVALKAGHHLIHDAEGRIIVVKIPEDPTLEGDWWKP
jgi:hypothetical protein